MARRFLPAVLIVAVQQVLFPMPAGVVVRGAIVGGLTALIALGMALTYRSDRVISFAQGDMGMVPAVLAYLLLDTWGWPWPAAVAGGLVASAVVGAGIEVAVIRRFQQASRVLLSVVTIGLAQVLAGIAILLPALFDTQILGVVIPPPFDWRFSIGAVVFQPNDVLALLAVPIAAVLLAAWLRRSRVGLAVRAAADRSDRAALLGVPVARLRTLVWALTGVLAFVAVFLRASVMGLPIGTALSLGLLLRALTALLLGRLTDLPAVAASATALGVLELGIVWGNPRFAALEGMPLDPILAAVIVATLLLRGRSTSRADLGETSSWLASDGDRPVPRALAGLGLVRLVRGGAIAALVAVALVVPHLLSVEKSLRASAVLVYALLGLSIVVLTGWTGQISLGQVALFAVGGAVGATALTDWGLDLTLAVPVAGLAGAAAAVVIGLPALRLRGLELAVITLAASLAVTSWLLNRQRFGWVPTERVPRPPLLGRFEADSPTAVYTVILAVLVLAILALRGIRHSRTGRAMVAMRDNDRAAQAYGLSPLRVRLTAFALSGGLAGIAGGLFVWHQQAFGQGPYAPTENLVVFTMVVVGGVAAPMGAVLGALWFQGIRWFLPGDWQFLASGAGVVLVLMVLPGGLGSLVLRVRDRVIALVGARHPGEPSSPRQVPPHQPTHDSTVAASGQPAPQGAAAGPGVPGAVSGVAR